MNELKVTKERVLEAASKCEDVKRVLKVLFPEAFEAVHEVGNRYRHNDGDEYILARTDYKKVALIDLSRGNRWRTSVVVAHDENISRKEFIYDICGAENRDVFTLIN